MEEIKIIFEDNDVLVLDKPAGWVTSREGRNEKNTVEEWVENNRPNGLTRSGIVHRLDKGTSGILVVAKNADSLNELKRQFKQREVVKKYTAVVCGDVVKEGEMNVPIGRSKYVFGKWGVNEEGKPSRTVFRLISKYLYNNKVYSLVDVDLKTGRTHQIRVHFSYLKWPLLGDKLYGGLTDLINRPFLHASHTEILHPKNKKKMVFESGLGDDLELVINKLNNSE